ncbi:hypothetical protein PTSG_04912 [Salpingoeca rosetta]|uniref:RING-type domain-containing protein n=1 Tax=Salpingoeca rosetta (strain ATCC 50818 / BSB-021) TaxID=946362 RepID=F2U8Z5_SALR5|nr:uncharacterized protein PTSG_04912 [Salpingoeca rosetta]EGD73198.1 hypothetical protein PTSG_04912 [Salpingoeca rosetta]|eukprot:XP_004994229.1 hypothetical protein PTSG_04912 [Salpingoeca rosetta]
MAAETFSAVLDSGWRWWIGAAITTAVVYQVVEPAARLWDWCHSTSMLHALSPTELFTQGLGLLPTSASTNGTLWDVAVTPFTEAASFFFTSPAHTPRATYLSKAFSISPIHFEPGTFMHDMYWLVLPAFIVGIIGLTSMLLNSPIGRPALQWINTHKRKTAGVLLQGFSLILLSDAMADLLAPPSSAPSPFRVVLLLSLSTVLTGASLSLLSNTVLYLSIPATSLILAKLWATFAGYCSHALANSAVAADTAEATTAAVTHVAAAFPFRLLSFALALLAFSVQGAARQWWSLEWQKHVGPGMVRVIAGLHLACTCIVGASLDVNQRGFLLHVLPIITVSLLEFTRLHRHPLIIELADSVAALLFMVTVNGSLLYACHASIRWGFTFLDAPLLSLRFWLVDIWMFLIIMACAVLSAVAAWFVVINTQRYAPRALRYVWLPFHFTVRSIVPAGKMAVRVTAFCLLEWAGTALVDKRAADDATIVGVAVALAITVAVATGISVGTVLTMRRFRQLESTCLWMGAGAGLIHSSVRVLMAHPTFDTLPLVYTNFVLAFFCYDATVSWPVGRRIKRALAPAGRALKRAAVAGADITARVATRVGRVVARVLRAVTRVVVTVARKVANVLTAVARAVGKVVRALVHELVRALKVVVRVVVRAVVQVAMKLRSAVRGATPLLQFLASAAVTVLFFRPLFAARDLQLSDAAFLLSGWASTCCTVIMAGTALRSRRVHAFGMTLFDYVDFGLTTLAIHAAVAALFNLNRLLRFVFGAVHRVWVMLVGVVFNIWVSVTTTLRAVARAGARQFSLIWRNPLVAMLSAAVVIAGAYQVHKLGLKPQMATDTLWHMAEVAWAGIAATRVYIVDAYASLQPLLSRTLRELSAWRQIMVGSASSADLFRMASFAWVFYIGCSAVSVTRLHRRMRRKTIAVPIMVLYTTAYLAPAFFNLVLVVLVAWVVGSIVVWEHDLAERRQAHNQWLEMQRERNAQGAAAGAGAGAFEQQRRQQRQPRFEMPETDASEYTEQVFEATECIICQEEFTAEVTGYTLPCGHRAFHRECITDWFNASNNTRCPICRAPADQTTQWLQTVF